MIPIYEIHPMLVHFPIVFWTVGEVIAIIILLRGGDLSSRSHWSLNAFYALLAGTVLAALAAIFGDMALDHAVASGFPAAPMETHEIFAITTLSIFSVHTILRLMAIWRGYALSGIRGWIAELPGLIGIGFLIVTAYLGGELVYHLGVNVAAVVH
jgi:uncharacterized membrane protein